MTVETYRPPSSDLIAWAEEASQVHRVAQLLAKTSFVPKAFQGRPDEIAASILAGRELGLQPMAALRCVDVIEGRPSMSAIALRGMVEAAGHTIALVESTETRAVVSGHRRGEPTSVQRSVWTAERARKANLLGKKNWRENQQSMLVARATAECARLIAADSLIGMPYSSEELRDLGGGGDLRPAEVATTEAPVQSSSRRIKRSPATPPVAPAPEPEVTVPAEPEPVETPAAGDAEAMTPNTRAALMASYRDAGMSQRDLRMAHMSRVVGRPLVSANQLTETEARRIVADLHDDTERESEIPGQVAIEWPEPAAIGGAP